MNEPHLISNQLISMSYMFKCKSNFSNSNSYMKQDENNLKNEKLATTLNATASSFQFKASGSSSDIFVPKKLPTLKQDKHKLSYVSLLGLI